MSDIAEYIGTRDGVRYYLYDGVELTEDELQQHMQHRHDSKRAIDEWKQSTELPRYDPSAEALRRLAERGVHKPTSEQLLDEIEHVEANPPTPEETADGS